MSSTTIELKNKYEVVREEAMEATLKLRAKTLKLTNIVDSLFRRKEARKHHPQRQEQGTQTRTATYQGGNEATQIKTVYAPIYPAAAAVATTTGTGNLHYHVIT